MYGRSYQWLTMGTFGNEWWEVNDTDCTVDQVKLALESTILTDLLPLSTSGDITISGIVIKKNSKLVIICYKKIRFFRRPKNI